VTCTASDNCGTATNCGFTITVIRPPPDVFCSSNITVSATSSNGALVFYTSSANGGCSQPNIICTPPSGSIFPIGTTPVTCTASDDCGTTTNCGFAITVVRVPLKLTCSSNITVSATSSNGAVVFYTSSATGGCSSPNVICTPPSGSTFPIGTTPVTCTASDNCGTITNCGFTVTVNGPQLLVSFNRFNRTIVIAWIASLANWNLQESADLSPDGWRKSGETITTVNGTNSITLTEPSGSRFFRLITQ
jgi:hypothetical protein